MAFPKLQDNKAIQKLLLAKETNPEYADILLNIKNNMKDTLLINEVFDTIQCEGKMM